MDITHIPMARGFVYLAAVVGLGSTRRVLAWRLSITMEVDFCIDAVDGGARQIWAAPEIFNTDQGKPIHERRVHRPAAEEQDRH